VLFETVSDSEGYWRWQFGLSRFGGYREDAGLLAKPRPFSPYAVPVGTPSGVTPRASFVPITEREGRHIGTMSPERLAKRFKL
jgi:hypothetical protein